MDCWKPEDDEKADRPISSSALVGCMMIMVIGIVGIVLGVLGTLYFTGS